MRNASSVGVLCVVAGALLGCGDQKPPGQQLTQPQMTEQVAAPREAARSDGHTAANSLDWSGTYQGIVPCADCEGILTVVTLRKDMTYAFSAAYLGKPGKPIEIAGTFSWNDAGNTVILAGLENRPNKYFVGERHLLQLDMKGNKIEGASASLYRLQQQDPVPSPAVGATPLVGTTWYLKAIHGREITADPDRKKPYIILQPDGNRVNGFTGCNTFLGSYETRPPDRLSFSTMAATQKICPDMEVETTLFEVLGETDSFAIRDGALLLHKARMAPLAVFEAGLNR